MLTVLSDKEILERLKNGEVKLEPFEPSCLNPAGYDLRSFARVILKPKNYELVATVETVELSLDVTAYLHIRSSLAREGVIGSFAVVDPGFRGQLTLNLHNVGEKTVTIGEKERIVQIVFHRLGSTARKGYSGSYQDSKGIVTSRRNKTIQKGTWICRIRLFCGSEFFVRKHVFKILLLLRDAFRSRSKNLRSCCY